MSESFEVFDECLIRKVVPARGRPYQHRCRLDTLDEIAHAVDESGGRGFTIASIVAGQTVPWTQASVALAFLRERGIIEARGGRNYIAATCAHLDAMTEYWALAENA